MSKLYTLLKFYILLILLIGASIVVFAQETRQLAVDKPQAIADLKTKEGAAVVSAKWFVQNGDIVNADFKAPGPYAADALARHLRNKFHVKVNLHHIEQEAKNWVNTP